MTQKQLFILSFFVFLLLILLQLVGIFRLFMTPLLWGMILAFTFYPLFSRLNRRLNGRKNLASMLVVTLVVVLTVGPMVFFSGTLVKEVLGFYHSVRDWVAEGRPALLWNRLMDSPFKGIWDQVSDKTAALDIQLVPLIEKTTQKISISIVDYIQAGAKNFVFFILNYLVTIFILFFFLRDGAALGRGLKDLFPMDRENKKMVFQRLSTTVSAVVRGLLVTAVVQGLLAGIAFVILGVPYPIFLALLIAFLAVVPIGGAVLVWFPSAVYLFLSGSWGKAAILFLWGALVISMVDNFLKPLLIGEKTRIPTLFLFLAILGGLVYYGLIGIFLGPIMLALFLTLIEIYRKEYPST